MSAFAFAVGVPTHNRTGDIIDCFFPAPVKKPEGDLAAAIDDFRLVGEIRSAIDHPCRFDETFDFVE